ncbi:MAG: hypothetical protein QN163_02185 [Armatimonadota bacterium]|nr:hypothetical protein [Armatimonadota bacterium]MDR5696266.1 hypothetical protein [Armatimonadota bacterium]
MNPLDEGVQTYADPLGRWIGIVVFLSGVALLVTVFVIAYRELTASGDAGWFSRLFNLPGALFYKGGLLFIMGAVGSLVANKGIALYRAAWRGRD